MKPDYKETVLRYKDMVYRIAYAQCPCREDAEDVFQDVFLTLYKQLQKQEKADFFHSEEHLKSWLIRVTLNCCKLLKRSAWFRTRAELHENIPDKNAEYPSEREGGGEVVAAVKSLPEKYRPAVMMFYYEDMSCAEIAAALKMNEATVRTRLKRARERLKEILKEVWNDE